MGMDSDAIFFDNDFWLTFYCVRFVFNLDPQVKDLWLS